MQDGIKILKLNLTSFLQHIPIKKKIKHLVGLQLKKRNIMSRLKTLGFHYAAHIHGLASYISFLTMYRPQLLILSEFLPHSTEPDIIVELIDPIEAAVNTVLDMTSESDMIDYVVNHALLSSENPKVQTHIFHCKKTHQIVWALWIQPQQTLRLRYSYRILWPDGQDIAIY